MTYDELRKEFFIFLKWAMSCYMKARHEGLLALEDILDSEKISKRNIFEYGMQFVVDGYDPELINKILSNIINQEKDEYAKTLKHIQREAALSMQAGDNPRIFIALMLSYTDIPLDDPELNTIIADEKAGRRKQYDMR